MLCSLYGMHLFYDTAVGLVRIVLVVIHAHQQYLSHIALKGLSVLSVLNLLYGSADGLVVLQFHHQRGLACVGQGEKDDVRIAAS